MSCGRTSTLTALPHSFETTARRAWYRRAFVILGALLDKQWRQQFWFEVEKARQRGVLKHLDDRLLADIGITAKVVTAFTLVFFILLVNTLGGAKNVDNDIMTIAQLMGASKRDLLWKVTLPSALPWIFAGLSIALTYSLLGVIVAEILASNQGLGYLIASSAGNFDTAGVFAALVVLVVIAWLFSTGMRKIEGWLLRWKPSLTSA